ncbi:hypothetical protein [Streptomyces formicae]|uniref:Restriction endonuclease type IV Mrr domain-containing protein n=1 Tax=Streptomyces formicae TaxID=1616117 RepID=A0ABY3WN14_9ACTN|nr:hypothetical protein [Streptomyces formicae]UNM12177.1 hypothetical protein J4032_12080 [Streptomyces formicae]
MGDQVPVRCPVCRRTHTYAAPVFPCACGAPLAPPLLRGAPAEPIRHRTWTDDWVSVRCQACGRQDQWPQPELGCPCGTVLRIPVRPVSAAPRPSASASSASSASASSASRTASASAGPTGPGGALPAAPGASGTPDSERPVHMPLPRIAPLPRPAFQPVVIRTERDAVTAAALYLRWLGFPEVVQPEDRPASGIDLRGPGLVAQVDPTTRPATLRAVECLWLNGLSSSSVSVFFSLAGYAADARARADDLGVPLFVMDLTGTPQPVNGPADELLSAGA